LKTPRKPPPNPFRRTTLRFPPGQKKKNNEKKTTVQEGCRQGEKPPAKWVLQLRSVRCRHWWGYTGKKRNEWVKPDGPRKMRVGNHLRAGVPPKRQKKASEKKKKSSGTDAKTKGPGGKSE